ncbi:hypothetical protein ACJMK2_017302 [Sinanodonta woodiana]|uniref:Sushi domain-containing protein n=1 Tax=Sinanodonta woodiana TaxID=1069815 RepID=A0ABD3UWG4_SINWO
MCKDDFDACITTACFNFIDTCPYIFNGGYILPFCSSLPGESCTFMCYPGFVKVGFSLTCGNNGTWIQDTNSVCIKSDPCPEVFNGGYVEPTCSRVLGNSCTFDCNPGFVKKGNLLTCGNFGNWFPDTNSICVQLVEPMPTGPIHFGAIVGISPAEFIIVMIIIVSIVVWRAKRSGVRNSQGVPYDAGATCLNLTTRRQQPNTDVINSYPEPPPSFTETQMTTNEAPPTYIEAIRDPTRFNLFI